MNKIMPIIFISFCLSGWQIQRESTIYEVKLDDLDYSHLEDKNYKYITKSNYKNINLDQVKHLKFSGINNRKLPKLIKNFNKIETLNLSTIQTGVNVRWVDGSCEFFGYHKKSKLKKLPDWINSFSKLNSLNLNGHLRLNIEKVIKQIANLDELTILTIEVSQHEIKDLKKIKQLANLKKIQIYMENLTLADETSIRNELREFTTLKISVKNTDRKIKY